MKPRHVVLVTILTLAIAATALAHGGHQHQFLGTVKAVNGNQLAVTTADGGDATFTLTETTRYTKGNSAATKAELKTGVRVSVYVENDGKTAKTIKIAG